MSYTDDIDDNRAKLRTIDADLLVVQSGVESEEAARFLGQARAAVRSAEHTLAKAAPIAAPAGCAGR